MGVGEAGKSLFLWSEESRGDLGDRIRGGQAHEVVPQVWLADVPPASPGSQARSIGSSLTVYDSDRRVRLIKTAAAARPSRSMPTTPRKPWRELRLSPRREACAAEAASRFAVSRGSAVRGAERVAG